MKRKAASLSTSIKRSRKGAATRRRSKADGGLVEVTLQLLHLHGVWAWRANSGAAIFGEGPRALSALTETLKACGAPEALCRELAQKLRRRFLRMGEPGTPDVLGVDAEGRLFGIECKRAEGKVSETQQAWHEKAQRHHVVIHVVRSVSDAREVAQALEGTVGE